MNLLPIFLDIRGKRCALIGGGEVALRKANLLVRAGGHVHVIAPEVCDDLQQLLADNQGATINEEFTAAHLKDMVLVIAATDDDATNARVSEIAKGLGLPVNVVDQPELCSFIVPSIVDRTPIVVAISSSGASPILTRQIKEMNETMLPARIDKLAMLLQSYRKQVQQAINDFADRIRFWEGVLDSEIPELVYSGNDTAAVTALEQRLQQQDHSQRDGEVYLVGAGPGDPDLLTLRALRLMHKADVVLYDRLVSPEIMHKLRPDAEKIHVGKQRANHTVEQESINAMLVRLASEGKRVLRLKGGDPFIFGRGGEELASLASAGIKFQVVPGITAASGCAAYGGIPLTHRDHAHSVQFLTGHSKDGVLDLEWEDLVRPMQTLVFYMGLVGLELIVKHLLDAGMARGMPIAIVQQGTTSQQKVLKGTLDTIVSLVKADPPSPPTIIIIGTVVTLQENLAWFEGTA